MTASNGVISGYTLINDGNGGAFYNQQNGTVTLTNVDIVNNQAADNGGGFYNETATGTVRIVDGLIQNNRSNGENDTNDNNWNNHGGGFYNRGTVELIRTDVIGNRTLGAGNNQHHGGGFYSENAFSHVLLEDSQLTGNSAYGYGGGFFASNGAVTIRSTDPAAPIDVTGNVINSSEREGGGFYATGNTLVTLEDVNLSGNTATSHGGGFVATTDAVVEFNGGADQRQHGDPRRPRRRRVPAGRPGRRDAHQRRHLCQQRGAAAAGSGRRASTTTSRSSTA